MNENLKRIFDDWKLNYQPKYINGVKVFETTMEEVENHLFIIVAFDFRLETQPKILFIHCPAEEAQLKERLVDVEGRISEVTANIQ